MSTQKTSDKTKTSLSLDRLKLRAEKAMQKVVSPAKARRLNARTKTETLTDDEEVE